jgi:hypothetical protein
MYSTPTLATRFARSTRVMRGDQPLSEDQMRAAAPSIFAEGKHASRSKRYTYIPTIDVLRGLRKEGFQPFMVAQGASRVEGKAEFTKHMIRMRHAGQVQTRPEANEIVLINSHDGASSYQMLAGMFRFVCCNGLRLIRFIWPTSKSCTRTKRPKRHPLWHICGASSACPEGSIGFTQARRSTA